MTVDKCGAYPHCDERMESSHASTVGADSSCSSTISLFEQAGALLDDNNDSACWSDLECAQYQCESLLGNPSASGDSLGIQKPSAFVSELPPHRRKRDKVKAFLRRTFKCCGADEDDELAPSQESQSLLWQTGKLAFAQRDWQRAVTLTFSVQ